MVFMAVEPLRSGSKSLIEVVKAAETAGNAIFALDITGSEHPRVFKTEVLRYPYGLAVT